MDPEPRLDVSDVADEVERSRIEASRFSGEGAEAVASGTLLFIDSSHAVRPGGDGPFLYCSLLPSLPAGVLVPVHDIYLPFDYPQVYVDWGYAEQYLLQALLAGNDRFEVVCSVYHMSRRHPEAVRRAFGDGVARGRRFEGASFWLRSR